MEAIDAVKKAIYEIFGDYIAWNCETNPKETKALIDRCVYRSDEDPGGWAPHAVVVVHTETGIPTPAYNNMNTMEQWFEVDEIVREHGHNLYGETINGAIHAFYNM